MQYLSSSAARASASARSFFFLNIPSRDCGNLKSQCPIVFPRCMSYEEEDTCSALLYFLDEVTIQRSFPV
jgi:hypothetical protein